MKDLILMIAKSLVDKPDEVGVTEVKGDMATILELKVAKEDLGKVIDKQGKTAQHHPHYFECNGDQVETTGCARNS